MMTLIPEHGCARCTWWFHIQKSEWGRCGCYSENTYYKHAACDEYELDPDAAEAIDIGDEIHDDNRH